MTTRWQITSGSDCVTSQARKYLWKTSVSFHVFYRFKRIGSNKLLLFHTYHACNATPKANCACKVDLLFIRIKCLFGLSLIFWVPWHPGMFLHLFSLPLHLVHKAPSDCAAELSWAWLCTTAAAPQLSGLPGNTGSQSHNLGPSSSHLTLVQAMC